MLKTNKFRELKTNKFRELIKEELLRTLAGSITLAALIATIHFLWAYLGLIFLYYALGTLLLTLLGLVFKWFTHYAR